MRRGRSLLTAGLVALLTGVMLVGAQAAGAAEWKIQTAPSPGGTYNAINRVSCAAGTSAGCVAVGTEETSKFEQHAFVDVYGSSKKWEAKSPPLPTGATTSGLNDVSCTEFAACTAVGFYRKVEGGVEKNHILAVRWNGTKLTLQTTSAAIEDSLFTGVVCKSATWCEAMGEYFTGEGGEVSLAEIWNGTEWSFQESVLVDLKTPTLSCSTTTWCMGVGNFQKEGSNFAGAERWNGTSWAQESSGLPESHSNFANVACTSSVSCIGVGSQRVGEEVESPWKTLAEKWNGTSWTKQATVNPEEGEDLLHGISCTSTVFCMAAGYTGGKSGLAGNPLTESWNGTKWTNVTVPKPAEAKQTWLKGISCTSTTECTAVGTYSTTTGGLGPTNVVIERYE